MISPSTRLAALLSTSQLDRAADVVRRYFAPREGGGFTRTYFEWLGGGGDRAEVADVFTAEDLVAVSMLSVRVEGAAAIDILSRRADRLSELLRAVPIGVSLAELAADDLRKSWAPRAVYRELRSVGSIGPTTASKLLARKRPHLVPSTTRWWTASSLVRRDLCRPLHAWLVADGGGNACHLAQIRDRADVPDISLLRIFDILAWMTGSEDDDDLTGTSTRSRG